MPEPRLIACEAVASRLGPLDGVALVRVPCRHDPLVAAGGGDGRSTRDADLAEAHGRPLSACCQLAGGLAVPPHAAADCVELVAGRTLVQQLRGVSLVTGWWLRRWDEGGQRLPPCDARGAPLPAGGEVVLLDGEDAHALALLERFASAAGLGARRVVVGDDLLQATTARAALEAQLASERAAHVAATTGLREQVTTAATALEIFSQMAGHTDETTAVTGILDLFTILFAPRGVRLTVHRRSGRDRRTWATSHVEGDGQPAEVTLDSTQEYEWTPDGQGFRLRISSHGRPVGAIEVDGLAFPQYRERYLNMAIPIARACGMVIANARAMQGLVTLCASCRRVRDRRGDWQNLEAYIARQQDVEFSHAICPACQRVLYPGFEVDDSV